MATTMNSSNTSSPANSLRSLAQGEVSNPPGGSIASITIQNIAGMVLMKLNRQNYITCGSLFLPVLKQFKLLGLITEEDPCPPQFVRDSSGSRVLNAAYEI